MTKWPNGVPVFRVRRKYIFSGEVVAGGGFDHEGSDTWIDIGLHDDECEPSWEAMPPESLYPLNADARAMLAIAKAGAR